MSKLNLTPDAKNEILKSYENGWEDFLVKAVGEAIAGSIGSEVQLIEKESLNHPPPLNLKMDAQVSGVIGLNAGEVVGNICVTFPLQTIKKVAHIVYDREFTEIDKSVLDCAGEITNLVHGIFKRLIGERGYFLKASLPNVILGEHNIVTLNSTKYFRAEFTFDGFPFGVTLTVDLESK